MVADLVQIVHDCQTYFIICGIFRNKDTSCSAAAADVDLVVVPNLFRLGNAFICPVNIDGFTIFVCHIILLYSPVPCSKIG